MALLSQTLSISLLVAFLSSAGGVIKYNDTLLTPEQHKEFEKELTIKGVIPEVIRRAPWRIVYLGYLNGNHSVWPGAKLRVGRPDAPHAEAPFNVSWGANSTDIYTLCLFDFDSPIRSAPVLRSFIHWMVGNIPGTGVLCGETFFEYFPPRARGETGTHRYVLLVWRHGNNLREFKEPYRDEKNEDDRAYFNITAFENKYKLGSPIAMTYFECVYDRTIRDPHIIHDDEVSRPPRSKQDIDNDELLDYV